MMPGHRDRNLYYIESGTLAATTLISDEEQCMRFGYAGEIVAAVDNLILDEPSRYGMRALRRTSLLVIGLEDYRSFLRSGSVGSRTWEATLEWLLSGYMEREIDLLTPSPEERYRRVLARSPRLFQEVPAKYIANYLRMTPETLSRLKKDLG